MRSCSVPSSATNVTRFCGITTAPSSSQTMTSPGKIAQPPQAIGSCQPTNVSPLAEAGAATPAHQTGSLEASTPDLSRTTPSVTSAVTLRRRMRMVRISPKMPAEVTPMASATAMQPSGISSIAPRVEIGFAQLSGVARSSRTGTKRSVKAGPQPTGRTGAAAIAPIVPVRAVAEIAGVGVLDQQVDEWVAADLMREREGRRLVDPHQRRMDDEAAIHAEIERKLHGLDRVVAAIRIAGEIGLAHPGDEMPGAAAIGERAGEGEEHQIAAGNERRWQSAGADLDRHLAGERRVRDLTKRVEAHHVVLAEARPPRRLQRGDARTHTASCIELGAMALAVIEADRFDPREPFERPGEAHRRILPAGEQHERSVGACRAHVDAPGAPAASILRGGLVRLVGELARQGC